MASPEAEAYHDELRANREAQQQAAAGGAEPPSLPDMRAGAEAMMGALGREPDGVKYEEDVYAGRPVLWCDPEGAATDRVVEYLHGGGYIVGSPQSHRALTGHLARAVGCRVCSVDYRMAPEDPHPAPVEDAVLVYRQLIADGYQPAHLAISGDSAGGGLTLATLLKLRDDGVPQPAGAVPLSPWTDLLGEGDSMTANAATDLMLSKDGLEGMVTAFLAGGDPRDPLASPVHADYHGVAPMYIQVGGAETLLDDAVRVADLARAAGVDVTLDVFPEMQHVFQLTAGRLPEADDAMARIGAWLRPRLGLA